MRYATLLLLALLSPAALGQSQNFEGFGLSVDYSLNAISDKSTPGTTTVTNSGMPSITATATKAINERWLVGVYGTYDLGTTDTIGTDPDAYNPMEAGGRVGYVFTEKYMGYIKLGYSMSKFSAPGFYKYLYGPSAGFGVEYLITKHLFARGEGSQQSYQTLHWGDGSTDKIKIDSYTISLGWIF